MTRNIPILLAVSVLALLPLTGVAFAGSSTNSPSQWAIYEQTTLPNGGMNFSPAGHGMSFSMPDATSSSPAFVNYMLDTYTANLSEGNTITATFAVTTSSSSTAFLGDTFGGFNQATPAFVRLFIQANLPNDGSATCGVGRANVDNFWWADVSSYTFANGGSGGTVTMSVSLNSANWSGICGNPASADQSGFDLALANIKYVGLSFGSGYFFASGVGVDGTTGTATFTLTSYTIS
ncbi:MAG TPA: hypothetical protein VJR06_04040 [Nitrososphaerales archaeon]|nr:hypothetical protein [Nitrososphaerales archaeon]